ncbi:MAG: GreA/GreB family elongation factor [Terriglobia bacterium]
MPIEIKKKLEDEIQALDHELNYELPKELRRARALGDLSENAEYSMAKQRQDYVAARLVQLKRRLADLSLINLNNIPRDRIAFGTRVVLYDVDRDAEVQYKLVTTEESDVSKGLISTTSPIGRGLMGRKIGDTVTVNTPKGAREFEVRSMVTIYDEI